MSSSDLLDFFSPGFTGDKTGAAAKKAISAATAETGGPVDAFSLVYASSFSGPLNRLEDPVGYPLGGNNIPYFVNMQLLQPTNSTLTEDRRMFWLVHVDDLRQGNTHLTDLFLKVVVPAQYSADIQDRAHWCTMSAAKLISQVKISVAGVTLESLETEALLHKLNYKFNTPEKRALLAEMLDEQPLEERKRQAGYRSKRSGGKYMLLEERKVFVPLLGSLFGCFDDARQTLALSRFPSGTVFSIEVTLNKLSSLMTFSPAVKNKLRDINPTDCSLVLKLAKIADAEIEAQLASVANATESGLIQTTTSKTVRINGDLSNNNLYTDVVVTPGNLTELVFCYQNGYVAGQKEMLFYGSDTKSATLNFLNGLCAVEMIPQMSALSVNLRTGLFATTGLANSGNLTITAPTPTQYWITINLNGENVHEVVLISQTDSWANLSQDVFFDLGELSFNPDAAIPFNLMSFRTLTFLFTPFDAAFSQQDSRIRDLAGNSKLNGPTNLFVDAAGTQAVFGFISYEINESMNNDFVLGLSAARPVDEARVKNVFAKSNCVLVNDPTYIYFDLDERFKVNDITLFNTQNNTMLKDISDLVLVSSREAYPHASVVYKFSDTPGGYVKLKKKHYFRVQPSDISLGRLQDGPRTFSFSDYLKKNAGTQLTTCMFTRQVAYTGGQNASPLQFATLDSWNDRNVLEDIKDVLVQVGQFVPLQQKIQATSVGTVKRLKVSADSGRPATKKIVQTNRGSGGVPNSQR
jgi:hypothetical protein